MSRTRSSHVTRFNFRLYQYTSRTLALVIPSRCRHRPQKSRRFACGPSGSVVDSAKCVESLCPRGRDVDLSRCSHCALRRLLLQECADITGRSGVVRQFGYSGTTSEGVDARVLRSGHILCVGDLCARHVHRCTVDMWQHERTSLRQTAEFVRS